MVPKNNSYVIGQNGMVVKEQPSFSYEVNKNYGNLRLHQNAIEDLIFNHEPPQKDPLMNQNLPLYLKKLKVNVN